MSRKIELKNTGGSDEDFGRDSSGNFEMMRISLFEITGLLLKKKKWIFGTAAAFMFLAAIVMFMTPNKYTSYARILPSGNSDRLSALQELAQIGGLTGTDENSSELFPVILRSRHVGQALLGWYYSIPGGNKTENIALSDYFKLKDPNKLLGALAKITSVSMDKKSGVIDIGVETKLRHLSQAILKAYIVELENFNLYKRRSQAREAASYLEKQLADTERELKTAEDSLEEFQNVNRGWAATSNPEILKILARFQREIEIKSKTYLTLSQEYELAKLNARKDIPVVRILDQPSLPTVKSGPKRLTAIIMSGFAGFMTAIILVIVFNALGRAGSGPDREAYEELRENFNREFSRVNSRVSMLIKRGRNRQKIEV